MVDIKMIGRKIFWGVFGLCVFILGLSFLMGVEMKLSYPISDMINKQFAKQYFNDNNEVFDFYVYEFMQEETEFEEMYDMSVEEFGEFIGRHYYEVTHELSNPCIFYSYLWSEYLDYNNIKYNFIPIETHIFNIAYDEKGYYILDQFIVQRFNY